MFPKLKSALVKPKPGPGTKMLGKAWARVRSVIVVPMLRRECVHRCNGDYNHYVTLWLDLLRMLTTKEMRGPEGASIEEMLQINLINELARHRAVQRSLYEVSATDEVSRAVQLLMQLRKVTYRAVSAHYELKHKFFGRLTGNEQVQRTAYITRRSATDELGKWFERMQNCDGTVLKGLPRYPSLPPETQCNLPCNST